MPGITNFAAASAPCSKAFHRFPVQRCTISTSFLSGFGIGMNDITRPLTKVVNICIMVAVKVAERRVTIILCNPRVVTKPCMSDKLAQLAHDMSHCYKMDLHTNHPNTRSNISMRYDIRMTSSSVVAVRPCPPHRMLVLVYLKQK